MGPAVLCDDLDISLRPQGAWVIETHAGKSTDRPISEGIRIKVRARRKIKKVNKNVNKTL
jgi:hypothetical protein